MPALVLLLPLAALALYLYSTSSEAAAYSSAPGDAGDVPLAPESTLPDYAAGLFDSLGVLPTLGSTSGARGIRNNNPGNIRDTGAAWVGRTGSDGAFVTFDTPANGIRALAVLLRNYQRNYHLDTVSAILARYAPASENNTAAYVAHVAGLMGVGANQRIDLGDPVTLQNLVSAIITHENGVNPYDGATIAAGVLAAGVA